MLYFEIKKFLGSKSLNNKRFILFLENLFEKSVYNFTKEDLEKLKKYIEKYIDLFKSKPPDYPIEYLTKKTYFFGYKFFINENVLIPRRETENLVEEAIKVFQKNFHAFKKLNVLDLCCGSGCIGISFYNYIKNKIKYKGNIKLFFSDISLKALKITKLNLKFHKMDAFLTLQDKLKAFKSCKFHLILSNPPYIETNSPFISKEVKYEPQIALFASLDFLKTLSKEVFYRLKENGVYIFECAPYQIRSLKSFLNSLYKKVEIYFDYNQLPRGFICYK